MDAPAVAAAFSGRAAAGGTGPPLLFADPGLVALVQYSPWPRFIPRGSQGGLTTPAELSGPASVV